MVEKQEKKVKLTLQERKMLNFRWDDSIQSEKRSTDHEKDLRNLMREIRKSMVYLER